MSSWANQRRRPLSWHDAPGVSSSLHTASVCICLISADTGYVALKVPHVTLCRMLKITYPSAACHLPCPDGSQPGGPGQRSWSWQGRTRQLCSLSDYPLLCNSREQQTHRQLRTTKGRVLALNFGYEEYTENEQESPHSFSKYHVQNFFCRHFNT